MFIRSGQDYFGFFFMIYWYVTFLKMHSDFDIYLGNFQIRKVVSYWKPNKWDIETNLKLNLHPGAYEYKQKLLVFCFYTFFNYVSPEYSTNIFYCLQCYMPDKWNKNNLLGKLKTYGHKVEFKN